MSFVPKLSVVMPVHNGERYIEKSVGSLLRQTYRDFEIIIINDGSTDESENVLKHINSTDIKISVYHQENKGPSQTRNFGIEKACGEYLYFMDCDDYLDDKAFELMMPLIEEYSPDILFFGYTKDYIKGNEFVKQKEYVSDFKAAGNKSEFADILPDLLEKRLQTCMGNKIYRLSLVKEHSFNESVNVYEDSLFHFQLYANVNKAVVSDKLLYHYVQREEKSLVKSFTEKRLEWFSEMCRELVSLFKKFGIFENNRQLIYNYIFDHMIIYIDALINKHNGVDSEKRKFWIRSMLNKKEIEEVINGLESADIKRKIFIILFKLKSPALIYLFFKLK